MAAVLSPSHYGPAHGILINRSPSVSPYHHSVPLPPLVPSNPSLSSSTSSASDLATDSDYYSSSSATTSSRPGRLPHDAHESKPRSGSAPNSRRIRFAPLPDPRRNIFIAVGANPDLPSVLLDDAAGDDEQKPSQNFDAPSTGEPATPSFKDQYAKVKSAPAGSLLFRPDDLAAAGSTPTLGSTATITPHSATFPSELGGEWNHVPYSPRPSSLNFPDDIPRRSNSASAKWSKKFLKPLLGPLASSSGRGRSTDDLRTPGSTTSLNSMVPLTPQSTGGSTVDSRRPAITSPRPLDKKSKKKREKGPEPDWVREFGQPLYRWSSEDPTLSKKGRVSEMREAASDSAKERDSRPRSRSANGTRLLNGRVYGAKRFNNANPFANARSEEPRFVEWGYGGMGSVQSNGVGANIWAKVQSSGGVSVGAHESASKSRPSSARDDDDDGSGMAWVQKRRARKEQERKKTESSEQTTSTVAEEPPPATEPHASGSDFDPPAGKEDTAPEQVLSVSPTQLDAALPEGRDTPTKEQHMLQAVTLPPVHHHHHHRGPSYGTLERVSSAIRVEAERKDSTDTVRDHRLHPAQEQQQGAEVTAEVEDARPRADSVSSKTSAESSSSSSSGNDDADEEDLESPQGGEEEDEEDMDEELEVRSSCSCTHRSWRVPRSYPGRRPTIVRSSAVCGLCADCMCSQERARLTALGAGVEKISRHKESTPVPEAGPE
ncbi:uncharacterized protein B0H18DRAFT_494722 [Fomitopsis serialis]|uniref:uncharacterized protein n=1 Tax=Fomitopsis serialis TaxID=139415 RepID=UPI002008EA5C|nr:uncharacterized protein B0H18DRAFT_494722 [Neoantrodia serialis]KAH9934981.1 hypothetical protein B0H18DRAFT_494722 [Neoantrodia serialis]